jgi:hypothetical protein
MNTTYVLQEDELRGELYQRLWLLIRKNRWTWQSICASMGLAGGLLSIALGTLLWMVVPVLTPGGFGPFLNTVEFTFFLLSLPLMALGAYCLDLLEKVSPPLPLPAELRLKGRRRWQHLRARHPHKN